MINFASYFSIIVEGGNVFKNNPTVRINLADIPKTVKFLSSIIGLDLNNNLLGSTGKRESSGDLDIAIPQIKYSKDKIEGILQDWCRERNLNPKDYIARSGISVHFRTPIMDRDGEYVQTDFMFVDNVRFAQFALANNETPPLLGRHRHIVLANLAKNLNLKWSGVNGLQTRDTGGIIDNTDPNHIARVLLSSDNVSAKYLSSIPVILEFLTRKYKKRSIIQSMLSEARETILKDGVDIFSLLNSKKLIEESITETGQRVGIQHLYSLNKPEKYSMDFGNFLSFLQVLQRTDGVIKPGNSSLSEKADGLAVRFGITGEDKYFLQGSYSGPVTDGDFSKVIKFEPVREAFEKNFRRIKSHVYKILLRYKKDLNLDGIRVQAEWLYSPFALSREDKPNLVYFVGTNYEKDKLGTWSTFALIDVTDFKGNSITDDVKENIINALISSSTPEVKFIGMDVDVFPVIDLRNETQRALEEVKALKTQYPDYERVFLDVSYKNRKAKKELREHFTRVMLPYQRNMHEKILNVLRVISGKLGEYEGFVIKITPPGESPFAFKVITPEFHRSKGRI